MAKRWGIVVLVWVGVFASFVSSARACAPGGAIASVTANRLRVSLAFQPGASNVEASAGSNRVSAQGGVLELGALGGLDWSVKYDTTDGAQECRVSFPLMWQADRATLQLRVVPGTTLPKRIADEAADVAGAPVELSVRAKPTSSQRPLGPCGAPLGPAHALPTDVGTKDHELLVKVANGQCIPLFTLRSDPRKVVVEQGGLKHEVFASDPGAPALPIVRDAEDPTVCYIDDGAPGRTAFDCSLPEVALPKTDTLPAVTVGLDGISLRVVPRDSVACPPKLDAPPADLLVTAVKGENPTGKLCAYLAKGKREAISVSPKELLESRLPGTLLQFCAASATECNKPQAPSDTVELVPRANKVRILLGKPNKPLLRVTVGRLVRAVPLHPQDKARTRYVKPAALNDELARLLCSPLKAARRDAALIVPPQSFSVSISVADGSRVDVPVPSWKVKVQDGIWALCPQEIPLRVEEVDKLTLLLQDGQAVTVTHFLGGAEFSTLTLLSESTIPISSIGVRKERERGVGAEVTSFAATRNPPVLGSWLCVQTSTLLAEGSLFPVDLGRIALLHKFSGKKLGTFEAEQGTLTFQAFRHDKVEGGEKGSHYYCAKMGVPGGAGLQFKPVDGNSEQTMTFAWDGKVDGCRDSNDQKRDCGTLDPDFAYYGFLNEAWSFSHIDVGVWQTTTDTSRVRISAMIPLAVGGIGVPGIVSAALELGGAVPVTLASQPNEASTSSEVEKAFVGIGLGGYASACIKVHVQLAPRFCAGAMADIGVDLNQRSNGKLRPEWAPVAGYFISVGAGVR